MRAKVYARLKWMPSDLFVPDKLRIVQAKLLEKYRLKPSTGQTQSERAPRDQTLPGSGVLQPANHITNGQNLGKKITMQALDTVSVKKVNPPEIQPRNGKNDVRVDENCSDDYTSDTDTSLSVSSSD
ncbi:unnamed protein product [Lymnaea stagnalis]|uniref:Uncharacterized protein n=1 Tax=Lymnaea stagnalis TaxID=6523 RepID=A0AAV2I6M4_LYMST